MLCFLMGHLEKAEGKGVELDELLLCRTLSVGLCQPVSHYIVGVLDHRTKQKCFSQGCP
jgi:hypothetical protein